MLAFATYAFLGNPALPALPLAERTPPETWTRSPPDWTEFSELARLRRLPARERKLHGLPPVG